MQELKIRFMSTYDMEEQQVILKVMIILYQKHYQLLKELKTIPYWIKILDSEEFSHCHFLILQLIYSSLNITYAKQNLNIFLSANGLKTTLGCFNFVFKEMLTQENPAALRKKTTSSNFTTSKTNSVYFSRNNEEINISITVLKILELLFQRNSQRDLIPLPIVLKYTTQEEILGIIVQSLLIENSDLTREVLKFISTHLRCHYSLTCFKKTGFIELLIMALGSKNAEKALDLLEAMHNVAHEYNEDLLLNTLSVDDFEAVQKIEDEEERAFILSSLFLRYLPVPMIKCYYQRGKQIFLDIFRADTYESESLIWSTELRETLIRTLRSHTSKFIDKLKEFSLEPD